MEEFLTPKEKRKRQIRNRMVYNDWRLHGFVQMLASKRLRFGKEFSIISTRDRTKMRHVCKHKQDMQLWKRTYYCVNCGLVMDRDANSAVNMYQRFVAWPGPHTQL